MSKVARSDEELLEDFEGDKAHNETESTATTHLSNLEAFRKWLREERDMHLTEVGKRDVRRHLRELKKDGCAPKTVGARHTAIQVFYKWLVAEGVVEENPTESLKAGVDTSISRKQQELRSDTPPAVTVEEKEKLCEHVPNPKVRNELMIRLMFQTGVREKELRNIRLQDIDRQERSITIENAKDDNRFRTVYYNDLEPWLSMWLDEGRRASMRPANDSPYLFLTNRSEQLIRDRPNKIIKQAADNAEIQETIYEDNSGKKRSRITSHALRHGFARHCVTNGMDISFLKELMGHKNLDTTKVYLKFTDDDKKDAVRKHGPRPDSD